MVLSIYYTTSDKMAEDVLNKAKSDMISYKNMFASLTNLLPEEANEINKIALKYDNSPYLYLSFETC